MSRSIHQNLTPCSYPSILIRTIWFQSSEISFFHVITNKIYCLAFVPCQWNGIPFSLQYSRGVSIQYIALLIHYSPLQISYDKEYHIDASYLQMRQQMSLSLIHIIEHNSFVWTERY